MKRYHTQDNIGKAKYVVNYHDGAKTHSDGSDFFDIAIFKSKKERDAFIALLVYAGYVYGH